MATAVNGMKNLFKAEESRLLGYYAVLLGNEFPTFRRILISSKRRELPLCSTIILTDQIGHKIL